MKGAATQVIPDDRRAPSRPGQLRGMDAARLGQVRTMSCPVPAAPSKNLGLIVFEPDPQAYKGKVLLCSPFTQPAWCQPGHCRLRADLQPRSGPWLCLAGLHPRSLPLRVSFGCLCFSLLAWAGRRGYLGNTASRSGLCFSDP